MCQAGPPGSFMCADFTFLLPLHKPLMRALGDGFQALSRAGGPAPLSGVLIYTKGCKADQGNSLIKP